MGYIGRRGGAGVVVLKTEAILIDGHLRWGNAMRFQFTLYVHELFILHYILALPLIVVGNVTLLLCSSKCTR
jgi:hypothetical protein